ncbi:hypothetical protein ACJX0J_011818, partial [Zea mays]
HIIMLSVALLVFPNGEVLEMNMNPNIAIIQIAFFGHICSCIHIFLGIKLKNSAYMLDDYKCDLGSIAHYCFILLDDLMLPKELGVYCLIAYALCNLCLSKTVNWTPFLFKLPNAVLTMFGTVSDWMWAASPDKLQQPCSDLIKAAACLNCTRPLLFNLYFALKISPVLSYCLSNKSLKPRIDALSLDSEHDIAQPKFESHLIGLWDHNIAFPVEEDLFQQVIWKWLYMTGVACLGSIIYSSRGGWSMTLRVDDGAEDEPKA